MQKFDLEGWCNKASESQIINRFCNYDTTLIYKKKLVIIFEIIFKSIYKKNYKIFKNKTKFYPILYLFIKIY